MAQRKRNERSALARQSEQMRLDEDGYERPGPHADVLFVLDSGHDHVSRPVLATRPEPDATPL